MPVACPICNRPVDRSAAAEWLPFCSERCKLVDLSRWLDGDYVIPGRPVDPEEQRETDQDSS